ncbi:MAG: DUF302 domain-containing protein [Ignavibacteria bacterium]|nr:DUF302 domain-containing protein [Ignavibacteria bacterium]HMQ97524.1 DUF302 domain-containing protein [Ignavibacteria bacterium]
MKYLLTKYTKSNFEVAVRILRKELESEGFIIINELNVKDVFKDNLNYKLSNYKLFIVYNPLILFKGIQLDKESSLLIPFNIAIRELKNASIRISVMNYSIAMRIFSERDLLIPASITTNKLKKVLAKF